MNQNIEKPAFVGFLRYMWHIQSQQNLQKNRHLKSQELWGFITHRTRKLTIK